MIKKINADAVIEEICAKSSENEIIIYGAGYYGKITRQYLKKKYDLNIKYFAVSSQEHMNQSDGTEDIVLLNEAAKENSQCILIIAIAEQKQEELTRLALSLGFTQVYQMLNEFMDYMKAELKTDRLEPLKLLNFEVHITDHCNLNCSGCIHFSPLSEESFLPIENFEKDFMQMSRLCGDRISQIVLLGGEPLLHPQISEFLPIARKYFRKCTIILLTNGVLLDKMNEEFWRACAENSISLKCTRYPIKIDYSSMEKKANDYGLELTYQNDMSEGEKTMFKYPFDLQGNQPIEWNYKHCTRSNFCITLKNGRLFTCPLAAHAHIAKTFFDLDIELSDQDSIDIYKAESFEELTNFLITPIPFCRYCNVKVKPEQKKWSVSKKRYEEWF